jgi:Rad3-related DNA helicase
LRLGKSDDFVRISWLVKHRNIQKLSCVPIIILLNLVWQDHLHSCLIYFYLVIRQAMGIDLEDAIVIIDEAHNIEDVCRSAGSFEWSQENVYGIELEIKSFLARANEDAANVVLLEPTAHHSMLQVCSVVLNWMSGLSEFGTSATSKYQSFETKIDIYEGQDIVNELMKLGITNSTVELWSGQLGAIEEATRKMMSNQNSSNDSNERKRTRTEEKILSSGSCRILSSFFFTLQNIFYDGNAKIDSFRLVKYSTFKMSKEYVFFNCCL